MSAPPPWTQSTPVIVYTLIGINAAVFVLWHIASQPFMALNFLVSWAHLLDGRYWVVLTSAFSHNMLFHLLINLFVLWSFGTVLERLMGPARFLGFYLTAALVSSIAHVSVSQLLLGMPPHQAALGASGAVAGLLLLFAMTFPTHRILLFGVIPMPAIVAALAFIGIDVWGLFAQADGGGLPIGHGAHLGGAFTGIVYYLWLRYGPRDVRR